MFGLCLSHRKALRIPCGPVTAVVRGGRHRAAASVVEPTAVRIRRSLPPRFFFSLQKRSRCHRLPRRLRGTAPLPLPRRFARMPRARRTSGMGQVPRAMADFLRFLLPFLPCVTWKSLKTARRETNGKAASTRPSFWRRRSQMGRQGCRRCGRPFPLSPSPPRGGALSKAVHRLPFSPTSTPPTGRPMRLSRATAVRGRRDRPRLPQVVCVPTVFASEAIRLPSRSTTVPSSGWTRRSLDGRIGSRRPHASCQRMGATPMDHPSSHRPCPTSTRASVSPARGCRTEGKRWRGGRKTTTRIALHRRPRPLSFPFRRRRTRKATTTGVDDDDDEGGRQGEAKEASRTTPHAGSHCRPITQGRPKKRVTRGVSPWRQSGYLPLPLSHAPLFRHPPCCFPLPSRPFRRPGHRGQRGRIAVLRRSRPRERPRRYEVEEQRADHPLIPPLDLPKGQAASPPRNMDARPQPHRSHGGRRIRPSAVLLPTPHDSIALAVATVESVQEAHTVPSRWGRLLRPCRHPKNASHPPPWGQGPSPSKRSRSTPWNAVSERQRCTLLTPFPPLLFLSIPRRIFRSPHSLLFHVIIRPHHLLPLR